MTSKNVPQFTLVRSTTSGVEPIEFPEDRILQEEPSKSRKFGLERLKIHSRKKSGELSTPTTPTSPKSSFSQLGVESPESPRSRGLSPALHIFHRSRSRSTSRRDVRTSAYVPSEFNDSPLSLDSLSIQSENPEEWEKRAEILALRSPGQESAPYRSPSTQNLLSKKVDEQMQEAIDFHEGGKLEEATERFKVLADPNDTNHPLAQVLLGLSLRHGWGCNKDEAEGFKYLRMAASNSALLDQVSEQAGGRGLAKGELKLAIYELGNCFRYGWGCVQDPVAAKTYYETAAQMGDPDAMVETAWCYLTGFGIQKKSKHKAAQYYRKAEKAGRTEVGNSWIWKDKYN
ncbi:hypothetical protein TRVA0_002S03576 [Trichomonascus vanleenenianus]|uniref:tetratricopeptide repeat protein n=1 Tax=Trichomonascus vanleenenianus TaxID=2268995 RepID=UPI003ECAD3E7